MWINNNLNNWLVVKSIKLLLTNKIVILTILFLCTAYFMFNRSNIGWNNEQWNFHSLTFLDKSTDPVFFRKLPCIDQYFHFYSHQSHHTSNWSYTGQRILHSYCTRELYSLTYTVTCLKNIFYGGLRTIAVSCTNLKNTKSNTKTLFNMCFKSR